MCVFGGGGGGLLQLYPCFAVQPGEGTGEELSV